MSCTGNVIFCYVAPFIIAAFHKLFLWNWSFYSNYDFCRHSEIFYFTKQHHYHNHIKCLRVNQIKHFQHFKFCIHKLIKLPNFEAIMWWFWFNYKTETKKKSVVVYIRRGSWHFSISIKYMILTWCSEFCYIREQLIHKRWCWW